MGTNMITKRFFNAMSYDDGGWFICEPGPDWEFKNKTDKPWFVTKDGVGTVNDDPEVQAMLRERDEIYDQLHKEIVKLAVELKLHIYDFHGNLYDDVSKIDEVCLDNDDGAKLTEALQALGWKHQFIPIGP